MTTTSRPKQRKAFTNSGLTAILAAGLLAASCSTTTDQANPEGEISSEAEIASETEGNTSTEADGNASTEARGSAEETGATVPTTPDGSTNGTDGGSDIGTAEGEAPPGTDDAPSVSIVVDPSAGQPILDSEDTALDHDGVLSCANIELAYISQDIGDEAGVHGAISTAIDLGASSVVGGMNDMADNLSELSRGGLFADGDSGQLEAALATCIGLGYIM